VRDITREFFEDWLCDSAYTDVYSRYYEMRIGEKVMERINVDECLESVLAFTDWESIISGRVFCMWKCAKCGETSEDEIKYRDVGNHPVCKSCFDDYYFVCEDCNKVHHIDDMITTLQGKCICDVCADDHYYHCDDCGDWTDRQHVHCDDNHSYCNSCFDNYFYCEDCGDIIHTDDAYNNDNGSFCEHCYHNNLDDEDEYGIHEYGYKPDLNFKGDDSKLFFGTELEIDYGDRSQFKFDDLSEHFYCCNDGSLDDGGFEIISHPMTYKWFMENRPYTEMIKLCMNAGYKSHNTSTCGFHIHMSRDAFGAGLVGDARVTSFILFFEKFWSQIVKFSRRKYDAIEHYAARICDDDEEITHVNVCSKKNEKRYERYHCVNLSNYSTVEVRIFRGSLNEKTLISAIQLCKLFFELSVFNTDVIEKMTWEQLKHYAETDYPELITYMGTRNL
jgi:formylmethanofuran dehydrogenase subunit E